MQDITNPDITDEVPRDQENVFVITGVRNYIDLYRGSVPYVLYRVSACVGEALE